MVRLREGQEMVRLRGGTGGTVRLRGGTGRGTGQTPWATGERDRRGDGQIRLFIAVKVARATQHCSCRMRLR